MQTPSTLAYITDRVPSRPAGVTIVRFIVFRVPLCLVENNLLDRGGYNSSVRLRPNVEVETFAIDDPFLLRSRLVDDNKPFR